MTIGLGFGRRCVAILAIFAMSVLSPALAFASDLVFGPVTCERATGAPTVFNYSFAAAKPSQGFIVKVYNGGLEDTVYELVSSSIVTLNGVQILGPNNFNQNVTYLEVPVSLQAQNSLSVEVRGKPGGALVFKLMPLVAIDSPSASQVFRSQPITVSGHLNSPGASVSVNGLDGVVSGTSFSVAGVPLSEGQNILTATATYPDGYVGTSSVTVGLDSLPPDISITNPVQGLITNQSIVPQFTVVDAQDPNPRVEVVPGLLFVADGAYQLRITATDSAGNSAIATRDFVVDKTAPALTFDIPSDGLVTNHEVIPHYSVSDALDPNPTVSLAPPPPYFFEGVYQVTLTGTDWAGNQAQILRTFAIDKTPPAFGDLQPASGGFVSRGDVEVSARFSDTLVGINPSSAVCRIDGADVTIQSSVTSTGITCHAGALLADGIHAIEVAVSDQAENRAVVSWQFSVDTTPPVISVAGPANGLQTNQDVVLSYTVVDVLDSSPAVTITPLGPYTAEGIYHVVITATDRAGNQAQETRDFTIDRTAPVITITSPTDGFITNEDVALIYSVTDSIDQNPIVELTPAPPYGTHGAYHVVVTARDHADNQSQAIRDFTIDKTAPAITVTSPPNGAIVNTASIDIHGTVSDPAASVTVNGAAASVFGSDFTANGIALVAGDNAFIIIAQDAVGNRSEVTTVVTYTPPAPVAGLVASPTAIQAGQSATLEWSTENATTVSIDNGIGTVALGGSLVVSPTASTSYTLTATGPGGSATAQVDISVTQIAAVTAITASSTTIQLGESITLTWSAANATAAVINQGIGLVSLSGNLAVTPTSTTEYVITASGPDGPSRASVVVTVLGAAQPLPEGSFGAKYQDSVPQDATVQSYDTQRFAMVVGAVQSRDGQPIAGVSVSIHGHPEYGTATTDAVGQYSLPVEGGGTLTVALSKDRLLKSHRQVSVPWNEIAPVETTTLISEDGAVTSVVFDGNPATVAVHRSTVVSDNFGSRTATIVFTGDNHAYARVDGQEIQLAKLDVRATEYDTPESMPAKLPETTAYTYCTEVAADGVDSVRFEKPIILYVNNFLGFAVGTNVPLGSYDFEKSAWIASDDGKVVRLLDRNGDGLVDSLDANGDGDADDLNGNGDLGDEVVGLAGMGHYAAGETYWRVLLHHLSPEDLNWPSDPPLDAVVPKIRKPIYVQQPSFDEEKPQPKPCNPPEFNPEDGQHKDEVSVSGTPVGLHYADPARTIPITIPVSESTLPPSVKNVHVRITLAGKTVEYLLPPSPDQVITYEWDGKDVFGREAFGTFRCQIDTGYVYPAVFNTTSGPVTQSFAQVALNGTRTTIGARLNVIAYQKREVIVTRNMGTVDNGWSFSNVKQIYDLNPNVIFSGDGSVSIRGNKSASFSPSATAEMFSGNGASLDRPFVIGSKAIDNPSHPRSITVDAAGNLLFVEYGYYNTGIWKIDRDGILTRVLNCGVGANRWCEPVDVAVGKDGNILFSDDKSNQIRVVVDEDAASVIAGSGSSAYSGDNGPALEAGLCKPRHLAMDKNGNIFVSTFCPDRPASNGYYDAPLRKISPSGLITTIRVNAERDFPIEVVSNSVPIALDPDGNLYFASRGYYRCGTWCERYYSYIGRVDKATGKTSWYAGNYLQHYLYENARAIDTGIDNVTGLAADSSGNVFFSDGDRVRMISAKGNVSTLIGWYQNGAMQGVRIHSVMPQSLAAGPDGTIYYTNGSIYYAPTWIERYGNPSSSANVVDAGHIGIPGDDGKLYVYSSTGKHIETRDLMSGVVLQAIEYDTSGRIRSFSDQFGNVTSVNRLTDGHITSIVSPDGQTTTTEFSSDNHLEGLVFADGSRYSFEYDSDGRMTKKVDPKGNQTLYQFAQGRLAGITGPGGEQMVLSQTMDAAGSIISGSVSAEGESYVFASQTNAADDTTTIASQPDGAQSTFTVDKNLLRYRTSTSCGTTRELEYGYDPTFQFRYPMNQSVSVPSGLKQTFVYSHQYQYADGSLPSVVTNLATMNGRQWQTVRDQRYSTVTTTSPLGRTTLSKYDPSTQLLEYMDIPGFYRTTALYDLRGRLTALSSGSRGTEYAYDQNGNVDYVVAHGQVYDYTYDVMGRLLSEMRPDGSNVQYQYDANGNLVLLDNPNGVQHAFGYTANDQRSNYVQLLSGTISYLYDRDQRLKTVAMPSGETITNSYAQGNLTSTTTPDGVTTYAYLCGSRMSAAMVNGESITLGYDGPLVTADTRSGTMTSIIGYTYNNNFAVTSTSYAGAAASHGYDVDGLLTSTNGYTISRNAQNGLPSSISGNGMSESRTFSGYGELDGRSWIVGGSGAYNWSVTRDQAGRIAQRSEYLGGENLQWTYGYDAVSRLTDVSRNGVAVEHYTYDLNGNRLSEDNALRGIVGKSISYSIEDHVMTAGEDSYQYDMDGFLASSTGVEGTTSYSYSTRGELKAAWLPDGRILSYVHDPFGRRIAKQVNGTTIEKYLWKDQTTLLAVYDGSGNLLQRYSYADGRTPISMTAGGATYFLLTDQVGSLRAVADTSGAIVKRIDYDSFGNIIADSNPSLSVPFGFAGGLHDRDTGLVRFGARDYDPAIGRWTAKDPIDFAGGDTNLYAYVTSDPVNLVDPTGEIPLLIPAAILGGVIATWMSTSDANAPEGPDDELFPPQSEVEAGIAAASGAAIGVCAVRTAGRYIVKDPPHKGLGPHFNYGPRYPGSNHPRFHFGPRNTGGGNFTWKKWMSNGMPWRWK